MAFSKAEYLIVTSGENKDSDNLSKIVENAMLEEIQMQNNIPNIISENYYISIRLKPNIYLIIYSNPKEKFNYVFCIVMEKNTLLM